MSESENKAANWTVGLVGSIVLHAVIVGVFMFAGGGDSVAAAEDDDIPEMKAPSETEEPVTHPSVDAAAPTASGTRRPVAPSAKIYVVQKGDYANRIATKFGLTVQQLAALNRVPVKKLNSLAVGQRLKVAE